VTQPSQQQFDPEEVIGQLASQVGVLTAQLSMRDSALRNLQAQLDEAQARIAELEFEEEQDETLKNDEPDHGE